MASSYDVTDVLHELCDSVCQVLHSAGAGVALCDQHGRLRLATASDERSRMVGKVQERYQAGPCLAAIRRGRPIAITDVRSCDDWPAYRDITAQIGLSALIAVPMVLDGRKVGALDVYDTSPREWTDAEINAAEVLVDVAAAYVLNASDLLRARRTAEQLQIALDSRVVIEQAKGRLAGELDISVDDAFSELRRFARSNGRKLRELAGDVAAHGGRALADDPSGDRQVLRPTGTG